MLLWRSEAAALPELGKESLSGHGFMVWPPGEVDMCDSAKGPASYKRELKEGILLCGVFGTTLLPTPSSLPVLAFTSFLRSTISDSSLDSQRPPFSGADAWVPLLLSISKPP
ncbi:hypothetical protein FA13DRAFT_1501844 [Coprinellus micaceus]|uniref:Uncharacterized protein n=1 Tax=Coprinellus micaceus TaxID=71717 RepID=A0A4Y7TKM9_COPMI|nr:hypothetical protein FA13DRAFT_1501844 [Coprinellus micaceus]